MHLTFQNLKKKSVTQESTRPVQANPVGIATPQTANVQASWHFRSVTIEHRSLNNDLPIARVWFPVSQDQTPTFILFCRQNVVMKFQDQTLTSGSGPKNVQDHMPTFYELRPVGVWS